MYGVPHTILIYSKSIIALMQAFVNNSSELGIIIDSMYRKPSKKVLLAQRIAVLLVSVISVIVIVTGTILFILGYRLDGNNGLEQGALVQFDSQPGGATVTIDGESIGQTATKRSLIAGQHTFEMQRDRYRDWSRTLSVDAGTLTWLDYARLVPVDLQKQTVRSYDAVFDVEAAPDMQTIIVQKSESQPGFEVVDIRSQDVTSKGVVLPEGLATDTTTPGVAHRYVLDEWDEAGRYILLRHYYGANVEWIVFDTESVAASVNVTRLLSIQLTDLQFASTNGNVLYGLTDGVVRKLDLENATISRGLVSRVESFSMYETSLFTYVGRDQADETKKVAGLYRDGDRAPHILRTVTDASVPLAIDTARFYTTDYVVISEGLEVTILGGRYPSAADTNGTSLALIQTFAATGAIDQLSFSPGGDYVFVRSGFGFMTYEVAHGRLNQAQITTSEATPRTLSWLDDHHLTAGFDGHLSMRDFDGSNVAVIMPIVAGFDATLSQNGRYIYGVNKTDDTYRLERVTMILQ